MPRSIHAAWFLSPEEKALWSRLVAATDSAVTPSEAGSWRAMRAVLRAPVVWCAGVWRGCYAAALYGVMYFTPLVLRSLRFGGAGGSGGHQPNASTAALLASIPFVLGAIAHLLNALHSSHTGERRAHIAAPWMLGGVLMAVAPVPLIHHHHLGTFVLFTAGAVGINAADGPDVSWVRGRAEGGQGKWGAVQPAAVVGTWAGVQLRRCCHPACCCGSVRCAPRLDAAPAGHQPHGGPPARAGPGHGQHAGQRRQLHRCAAAHSCARSTARGLRCQCSQPGLSACQPTPATPRRRDRHTGPYCIGSLSKATGNWHASLWFVSGAIFLAGAFVAAFPLRWAAHSDAPQIEERRSSELALRAARAHSSGGGHSVVAV